ncbi:hypothetical protein C6A37_12515, partial [Desulfobacteraceae bacterium SEEP-SAG9]
QRAIKDRKPADRFDPNDADDYYNRGLAYFSEGQNDKAISDYNNAIEINPKYAAARQRPQSTCQPAWPSRGVKCCSLIWTLRVTQRWA